MNVVDSSGWLEYFSDSQNAGFFAPAIEKIVDLLVPSICLLEVFKKLLIEADESTALEKVAYMHQGNVIPLDSSVALNAAKIGFDLKLPLADAVVLATARMHHAVLWTQDSDFKNIEGVKYILKRKR